MDIFLNFRFNKALIIFQQGFENFTINFVSYFTRENEIMHGVS